jgi:transcriptional regulator with XRE-family HTH domain
MEEVTRRVAEQIGKRIRRRRREQELRQEAIAWRAEIHRTQVILIGHGERLPGVDTLIKIAAAVGASPCELLDGLAWEPGDGRPGRLVVTPPGGGDD